MTIFSTLNNHNLSRRMMRKHLRHEYVEAISRGEKIYEGRLASKIIDWGLKIATAIQFYSTEDDHEERPIISTVDTVVVGWRLYDDFGQAFDALGERLLPGIVFRDEAIRLYNTIYHDADEDVSLLPDGVTSRRIRKEGVVIISLRL
jgi:ASC-1-like (ASCH) protein